LKKCSLLLAAAIIGLSACAHYPANRPLEQCDADHGYRFHNLAPSRNSDSLFVILAFSGGGTRAAALSYGVLQQLKDLPPIVWEGEQRSLLDEVDVISSVSGGSFTSAYFGLFGERVFTDFKTRFLYRDIEGDLARQLFYPVNWFRLMSPNFSRIDLAAEYYDGQIFDHATFSTLVERNRRPFLIINATDMTLGARFGFTQDQFDPICSDLNSYPVSRAVAASSAFPVLLSPITINNYAGGCDFREPPWVALALRDRETIGRRFLDASHLRSYENSGERPYLHLLDGGIADNIGLRGPLQALTTTDSPWSLLGMINQEQIRKVVLIVVNAKTDPDSDLDRKRSTPNLKEVLMAVATEPMSNYSFDTVALLVDSVNRWQEDEKARQDCEEVLLEACPGAEIPSGPLPTIDFYPVIIGFDNLADPKERDFFKNLPTSFTLPAETVDRLIAVGGKLLMESKNFQRLLNDLQ
jgi:NTE family protein